MLPGGLLFISPPTLGESILLVVEGGWGLLN